MTALKEIVLGGEAEAAPGGSYVFVPDIAERYIKALTNRPKLKRKLKVVAACGNGTAGAFAPADPGGASAARWCRSTASSTTPSRATIPIPKT